MNNQNINIIVTGGTFDKEYNELNGKLYFKKTQIHEMLFQSRAKIKFTINKLMLIDSLEMTDDDRKKIVDSCINNSNERIIITHGTDTMAKTALSLNKENLNKCIVLTGAMIPINFGSSDGLFNLGCAVGFVQSLSKGVYIAMNGNYFKADQVRKNRQTGAFENI